MYDEIINTIDDVEISVTSVIVEMYSKALILETYGIPINDCGFFQEGSTPERKTVLEKVIMFIPDMIHKFVEFIKKKLHKLFNIKPEEVSKSISDTITNTKHDNSKKKKIITAFTAAGLVATATAIGFKIYDKHNNQILTFEAGDNTSDCTIKVEYDLPHMIEGLQASVKIADELIILYGNKYKNQKQYKNIVKDINDATKSLKQAVSKTTTDKGYTIQSLLKELKTLETAVDKLADVRKTINVKGSSFFKSTEQKYEQNTSELNQAISEWLKEFNKFTSDISAFLDYINTSIGLLADDMYNTSTGETPAFGYLKALVTYCSYQFSPIGFRHAAIVNPWQKSEENIKPSCSAFNSFGKLSDLIRTIQSEKDLSFAWGKSKDYLCIIPKSQPIIHHIKDENDMDCKTYGSYAYIFGSPEHFAKATHFFLNTPNSVIERITTGMMIPNSDDEEDTGCILINKNILGKLMEFSQKSATGLSEDLIPKDNEFFIQCSKDINKTNCMERIKRYFPNATASSVKGHKNIYKLSLNGSSDSSPKNDKDYSKPSKVSDDQKERDKDMMELIHALSQTYENTDKYLNS